MRRMRPAMMRMKKSKKPTEHTVIPIQLFIQLIDDYHKLPTAERIQQEKQ